MDLQERLSAGCAAIMVAVAATFLAAPSLWDGTGLPGALGTAIHEAETAREHAAFAASLLASPPAESVPVPVIGAARGEVADTFGAPRGADRRHEGVDVFAPRGSLIVSAAPGIVARVGTNRLGGNVVFVLGPGGERYYYAHLDTIDPQLAPGQRVGTTTVLGTVGTTGNAVGTPPYLHFGIYGNGGALNPYDRLE